MTAEEKLTIIRQTAEEEYLYQFHASDGFYGSEAYKKMLFAKEWLERIDKIINEDEDAASKEMFLIDNDAVEPARKAASGINYDLIRTRDEIFIRGFQEGQYWRQHNPITSSTQKI